MACAKQFLRPTVLKISIIVPIYRVEAYIGRCAESLLSQSYPCIEFIFVDDGSPDASVAVLEEVLQRCPGRDVRILHQENAGQQVARINGLHSATGDYVMFVDSDDWLEPGAVERVAACAGESGADLLYFDFWKEYGSRSKLDRERPYTAADKTLYMKRLYRDRAYGYLWNKVARRSLFEGLFFPKHPMHEDVVTVTQLLWKAQTLVQLPEALLHYRRDNPSASTKVPKKIRRGQMARNYLDFYEFYRDTPDSPVQPVRDDLLLRAAWVGCSLDRELFAERPYLKKAARHLPLMPFHRVLLVQQLWLKCWLRR